MRDLPWWLAILGRLSQALPPPVLGIGTYVLGALVRSVQAGKPFDRRNPRRIVSLATLVAVGGTGLGLLHYLTPSLQLDLRLVSLVIAGVLLVVAVAFRQGRKLTQDVEGLV
jgi:hypothetical protein